MFEYLTDLSRLVKLLAKSGARIDGDHVLADHLSAKIRNEMGRLLSDEVCVAKVSAGCRYKNCVNPDHMVVRFNARPRASNEALEEIEILMSDLDFARINEVGAAKYAEEYNEGMPEELKITDRMVRQCLKLNSTKRKAETLKRKTSLTIKQFAKRIGFTPEWVSKLIRSGKITPRIRGCGQRYFLESDVEDWLNGKESPLFSRKEETNG